MRLALLELLLLVACFLLPIGVLSLHIGQDREVEDRRWRGSRPFQRAPVPGIAGAVAQLFAPAYADDELRDLKDDTDHDQNGAEGRDDQPGAPLRDIVVLHSPRHAEKAQDIKRHEGDIEADQPEPERRLAETIMQPETECLRKPVGVAGKRAEQYSADDYVVNVSD